jgi:hypothetical protein
MTGVNVELISEFPDVIVLLSTGVGSEILAEFVAVSVKTSIELFTGVILAVESEILSEFTDGLVLSEDI